VDPLSTPVAACHAATILYSYEGWAYLLSAYADVGCRVSFQTAGPSGRSTRRRRSQRRKRRCACDQVSGREVWCTVHPQTLRGLAAEWVCFLLDVWCHVSKCCLHVLPVTCQSSLHAANPKVKPISRYPNVERRRRRASPREKRRRCVRLSV
jgi:hypothetical protein